MNEMDLLKSIPMYILTIPGFNSEYPVYDGQKKSMTIVYDRGNKLFSLRITLTSDKKGLVTDNYTYAGKVAVNKLKKLVKAYIESYGYKVKLGMHVWRIN